MAKTITYGATTLDFDTLPEASLLAMLKRGVTHFLGSEQASKVSGYFDPEQENPPVDSPEARAAYKAECVAKAIAALEAGTVGVSNRGPAVDPIVSIQRRLAKAEILPILKKNGLKWPVKAEDTLTMPDGTAYTGGQLIDRRLAHAEHGPRIVKEAEKVRADQLKKAQKAEAAADGQGLDAL